MKKIIFVMLLLSTILLWYQWMMYAEDRIETDEEKSLIVLNVVEKENNIEFEQEISNLSPGTYDLIVPEEVSNISCYYLEDAECQVDGDILTVEEPHNNVLFSYQIQKEDVDLLYLINPLIQFEGVASDVKLTISS